jgi:3-deoxy-D-manno-octulosonic-acid transferase
VLDAHATVREQFPDALLVLVPRHPPRFEAVRALLEKRGVAYVLRSREEEASAATEIVLGDTMGELMTFYAAADVAFVAGSLVPIGGHNLLEPASVGAPILTGPHNFNAEDIFLKLEEAGAVQSVTDPRALGQAVAALFGDPDRRRAMGRRGREVVEGNRGAVARLLDLIEPLLPPPALPIAAQRPPKR